jgi:DNA-binding IclR family transcriptional regulator
MTEQRAAALGPRVREAARELTRAMGGREPPEA